MKIVLIILFILMAIICFMGMIAEKDLKLRKTLTIAFFALMFCITMLALKPFKIEFYILVMFTVCMYLVLFGSVFESFVSRKQIKTIAEYANVIQERNDKLCEANANLIERNKLIADRNDILAEKNIKLFEALDVIINVAKKDGE